MTGRKLKSKALILGITILILAVACSGITTPSLWGSLVMAESPPTDDSGIMTVFYKIADDQYLFWTDLTATIIDNGDGTWNVYSPQVTATGVNQALIDYDYYQYKPIPYGYNGTVTDLGLQPPTSEDLPRSQHIGKLVDVDNTKAKPATVTRKWHGLTFNITCLVSQSVVDMWVADTLNVGDFVIVSFIDEIPDTDEVNLAIVVDKVYKSW